MAWGSERYGMNGTSVYSFVVDVLTWSVRRLDYNGGETDLVVGASFYGATEAS